MAKTPMGETPVVVETEPEKPKRKILFLGLGLGLLLIVAGVAGWFVLRRSPRAPAPQAAPNPEAQVKAVLHLEGFVVNLADPEGSHFLRIGIDLGLEKTLPSSGKEKDAAPTSRIRDAILVVLTTCRSEELMSPEGKAKLKENLVSALGEHVPELGVREVYFTDFLVQR